MLTTTHPDVAERLRTLRAKWAAQDAQLAAVVHLAAQARPMWRDSRGCWHSGRTGRFVKAPR